MKSKKHVTSAVRKERMQARRNKQLFPFQKDTPLSEFINPKYHCELSRLIEKWRRWLVSDIPVPAHHVARLEFDWSIPDCTPSNVCVDLADFFLRTGGTIDQSLAVRRKGQKWKVGELMRYLTSADHTNLMTGEKTLNALIHRNMGKSFNKS